MTKTSFHKVKLQREKSDKKAYYLKRYLRKGEVCIIETSYNKVAPLNLSHINR